MFVESMCAGIYTNKTTEQAYEYFDYLANLNSDWACTGTHTVTKSSTAIPTQHVGTKYQLTAKNDLNAKLTTLSKQGEPLKFAKTATSLPKETSIMCALCDTMNHCTDMRPIMVGVKEARGQVNVVNQFLRSGNNSCSNTYNLSWRNNPNFG